jgi:2-methylcitrate dehydratase PrpD
MMRDIDDPAMVKHGIGWGAMNGITSAELAQRGFTGVPSLFGFEAYRDWTADIGEHYLIVNGLAWKRYACCAWDHAAIRGADQLIEAFDFNAEEIERVRVETFHETVRLGTDLPSTTEEAQFTLAWPLAAYIVDRQVGPGQILEAVLGREDIRRLAKRIELIETEELNQLYRMACEGDPRGKYASKVTIELHDGRVFETGPVEGDINYPQEPWTEEDLEDKFRWLTGHVLGQKRIDALTDMIRAFEGLSDVRTLTDLMTG